MKLNQPQNINQILNPPLGKKPNLTEKQIKNMRMILQSLTIPQPKNTYYYNIVQKQTNMGFSSNQRLLILNVQDKALSYLSKVPQGYLPYTYHDQITANKVKQKVSMNQVQEFKCNPLKGKISTMIVQWLDKDKKQKKWVITLGSSKLMNDWIGLINQIKNGNYDKKKYEQMNKVNNTSPLTSNNVMDLQNNNSQNNNPSNPQSLNQNSINNINNQPSTLPKTQQSVNKKVQPYKSSELGSNNPFMQDGQTQPNNNNNLANSNLNNQPNNSKIGYNPSSSNLNNNPNNQNVPNSNLANSNMQNSQTSKYPNDSSLVNSKLIFPNQSSIKPPQNNYTAVGQTQISRKPKIPKMGQSTTIPKLNPQPINNNFNTQYTNPHYNNYPPTPQSNVGPKVQNYGINSKVPSSNYLHPNDIDFNSQPINKKQSNQNFNTNPDNRTLNHNQSQAPGDFVQELKRKRQKNPQRFILNNQLSKKKLQHQPQQTYRPGLNESRQSNQVNNVGMASRVPSQHYLNRQNSGDKRMFNHLQSPSSSKYQQQPIQMSKQFSRSKVNNQNIQSIKDINNNNNNISRQPSKSGISNKLNLNNVNNNYDDYEMIDENDNYQGYKPSTSFPQSTKNLNKIRSDYLQRKAQHIDVNNPLQRNNKPYPNTSKNDSRLLKNNYVEDPLNKNHKYNQPPFQKLPKFDSTQKKRQDSLLNLNKLNTTYLSNNKLKSYPSYNDMWLQTSNPNKKIQIHDQFINRSRQLVKQIVQQIPFPKSQRQFQPVDSYDKQNLYTFMVQNLIIKLHFFNQQQSINGSEDNINVDAPVLYDHTTYQQIKREFYNYNLILAVTNNQGKIKVPLCCYIQYRGVVAIVKADIPQAYKQIQPYTYRQQFQALQNMVKVRFLFNTFNCYQSQGYRGGQGKFIVLWNLKNLIPGIPNNLKNQSSYFRKQFLLQYDQILEDLQSSSQAHAFTVRHIVPQLLSKLQSLQIQILHSKDLVKQLHRVGLSLSYLPELYKQTNSIYLKKIFMSEIVSGIFTQVVRSQLNHAFVILPAQNMQNVDPNQLDNVVVACAHVLINDFFSYTQRSQSIWKLIVNQASKRYRMIVSKQDVIPGYLLSGIVHKLSLQSDFKQKSFMKQKKYFVHQNILPRQVFITFTPKIRRFDMESICPTYSKCKQLLQSQQLSVQNYQHLSMILNLKNRTTQLPQYYNPIIQPLKTYIANYIPYTLEQQYQHLDVYEYMYEQPITYNGVKTAFLAIKWLIKSSQIQKANQVFQIKFHQLSYWLNQYNTAITQFYDFFSMFYASIGDFQESICLAKSSLINMTKVLGPTALPVADKHYQLGNIYFKISKKNEALKQYNKTKQILINHQKTAIPQYGIILLKISLLCLNFGQLTQCLSNAIQAERIFQNNGGNQNQQIECFQILSRVYQITRKPNDINNLCEACSKTFNNSQNPKIMERMLKIIMYPKLFALSSQQQKSLLPILYRLQQQKSISQPSAYLDSFNYLHKIANKNYSIKKKLYYYLQNIIILIDQVNRRDLIRKHISYNDKTNGQSQEMLVMIQAVGNMVGWSFLIGALKQGWYD